MCGWSRVCGYTNCVNNSKPYASSTDQIPPVRQAQFAYVLLACSADTLQHCLPLQHLLQPHQRFCHYSWHTRAVKCSLLHCRTELKRNISYYPAIFREERHLFTCLLKLVQQQFQVLHRLGSTWPHYRSGHVWALIQTDSVILTLSKCLPPTPHWGGKCANPKGTKPNRSERAWHIIRRQDCQAFEGPTCVGVLVIFVTYLTKN